MSGRVLRHRAAAVAAAASALAVVAGLGVGSVRLAPAQLWQAVTDPGGAHGTLLWQLRAPRVLLAYLVGGGLAVSGAALQALVRNPLADPYLLGMSGGAGLGAVAAIAAGVAGPWGVPLAAFAGAVASVGLVYRLSVVAGHRLDPRVLVLAGVVVGAFAASIMTTIVVLSSAAELRNAFLWLLGGLGAASWPAVAAFGAYAVLPLGLLFLEARSLDLLALGEEPARHLGADVERTRRIVVLATALLTAASVALCGIIGFVGLVVPHAVRLLNGPLHRPLLPLAFACGGAFLVAADTVARSVVPPLELPVGAVTALAGVPLFAVLLRRSLA